MTAAPKSILRGCELRYGPLGVHRMCLGCFESDSKKKFSAPSYRYFLKLKELRIETMGVHRMCLGCFESDSGKFFFDP